MSENSNSGPSITALFIGSLFLIVFGSIVWAYLYHSESLLTFGSVIAILVTVLSLIVIVQVGGEWDRRWWFRIGLPFLAVFICDILIWRIKSQLSHEAVNQVQQMNSSNFSFANVIPDLPKMKVRYFIGLLIMIPCQVWCGLSSAFNLIEDQRGYIPSSSHAIVDYAAVTLLVAGFAALIVFA
jgi:hypothetical protein